MKNLFDKTYHNKRVLVTGHSGFKGAWLSLWLIELGAKVIGYSLGPPTKPSLFKALKLDKKIIDIKGDIRDEKKLKEVFKKFKPEIVFHLAAQALVRRSYREPRLTFETNIIGTVNLFEAARETKSCRVLINVTTDKCYANQEWTHGYRETDPMGGYDPYSCSKGCSELITSAYINSFFNPDDKKNNKLSIASARAGNVIGGGDWAEDRLIPDCIRSITTNKSIFIRNPNAIRPWQYVLEPLSGYLALGSALWKEGSEYNGPWNFGPYDEDILSVKEISEDVVKLWGKGRIEIQKGKHLHEAQLLKLDIGKAEFKLKWKPVYRVDEALKKTISWYRNYHDRKDMYKFSLIQIEDYVDSARKTGLKWTVD